MALNSIATDLQDEDQILQGTASSLEISIEKFKSVNAELNQTIMDSHAELAKLEGTDELMAEFQPLVDWLNSSAMGTEEQVQQLGMTDIKLNQVLAASSLQSRYQDFFVCLALCNELRSCRTIPKRKCPNSREYVGRHGSLSFAAPPALSRGSVWMKRTMKVIWVKFTTTLKHQPSPRSLWKVQSLRQGCHGVHVWRR